MSWFENFHKQRTYHAIGLMSGTSADGLDMAYVHIEKQLHHPKIELLSFHSQPFTKSTRQFILGTAAPSGGSVEDVCRLNFFLGHLFSDYVLGFMGGQGRESKNVDFIGSHGQTICHLPRRHEVEGIRFNSTLQVADPSVIANRMKITTVGEFRTADMAFDGEGAPLVPFFDFLTLGHSQKNRILLNIGGIANLTALPANGSSGKTIAFDTGPGNLLIDLFAGKLFDKPYDRNGDFARRGESDNELLEFLLAKNYFERPPPKSSGGEHFAGPFAASAINKIEEIGVKPVDVLATITELTARTIFEAVQKFLAGNLTWDELIISGGGAENQYLLERLAEYFGATTIMKSDDAGIPSDAKEAVCFAVLGYYTLLGLPSNLPSATGAKEQAILGKICVPCSA